ncbi:lysine biosynthesis protein LysW [Actinosynnema sp. NPDC059797]
MAIVKCPECNADVELGPGVMVAEIVDCGTCSSGLEVVSVEPLILALAPDVEEDWGE